VINVNRTLRNWRWWATLPVVVLALPLIILDWITQAMILVGEWWQVRQFYLVKPFRAIFKWSMANQYE